MGNIISFHQDLTSKIYKHSKYQSFKINDPKPRDIHKASVRDRLLHRAIYRILYPFFDRTFIADSFSCRLNKGTHKALNRFRLFARKVGKNNTKTCWILKCDIRKFFANIDHDILKSILCKYIEDKNILWLLSQVIDSFNTDEKIDIGLPLGNLTSQIFVNIYMNEFDNFVKHKIKIKYYIRYADDFVIFYADKIWLENIIFEIGKFLENNLKLVLHDGKIFIKTLASGVDFLGWVHFPYCMILRTRTQKRMFKRTEEKPTPETINSYLGLLKHGNTYKLQKHVLLC